MASLLEISSEVADKYDNYHLEKLYCVCRFCYQRISGTASSIKKQPLSLLVIDRTNKFYGIDFSFELTDLSKPKSLCSSCKRRLVRLDSGEITQEKWNELRSSIEFQPKLGKSLRDTRQTVLCNVKRGVKCVK